MILIMFCIDSCHISIFVCSVVLFAKNSNMTNTTNITIASVLRAAGHPVRVGILELLKQAGETSVNDICEKLKIEQSLTSHHLNLLAKSGYIKGSRRGKFIFYSLHSKPLNQLLEIVKHELSLN